jgi:hypothetical protein
VIQHQAVSVAGDLEFFLSGNNLYFVRCEAERFEAARGGVANIIAVLADAAEESGDFIWAERCARRY